MTSPKLGFGLLLCCVVGACSDDHGPLFPKAEGASGGVHPGAAGETGQGGTDANAGGEPSAAGSPAAPEAGSAGQESEAGRAGNPAGGAGGEIAGGTTGIGAGSGTGGTGTTAVPCRAPHIVDDLEDQDDSLCPVDGHVGHWFTTNDGTQEGTQSPAPGSKVRPVRIQDRVGSSYAMHTSGRGFTGWGATLGFHVRAAEDRPFNASAFSAMSFYAKGRAPEDVRVAIRTRRYAVPEQGGSCVQDEGNCFHYHGALITLSDRWQQYRLEFDQLRRVDDWDGAFETGELVGVEFRVMPSDESFELWVDDVAFEE